MIFLALLPLSFGLALYTIIFGKAYTNDNASILRNAFLETVLLTSTYLVAITELLSLFNALSTTWLIIAWALPAALAAFYSYFRRRVAITKTLSVMRQSLNTWMSWIICGFTLISFGIALLYPTNNYDSLTYHMARVAHWAQNHSIDHYQTHIIRQLVFPPFAEWVILHLQILTSSDLWANTVQLFFFAACILNASLIAAEFGATYKQQWICAFCACLVPMAVIQSNTTQNDLVVAFFVMSFALITIRTIRTPSLSSVIFAGIALGLAWLTKGTAYLFTLGFCLWYIIALVVMLIKKPVQPLKQFTLFLLIPLIAIIINSGHFQRNYELSGSVLGKAGEATTNEAHEVSQLSLVAFKNFLNHMPVPYGLKDLLRTETEKLGIDIDDPRYNYNSLSWMKVGFSFDEDYAQNFVHTLLIIIIALLGLVSRNSFTDGRRYSFFGYTLLFSTLLFCITLKWQPWSNRLELSLFMLFSVVIGLEISNWKRSLRLFCYLSLFGFGIAALLWSRKHPLLPPRKSIFQKDYSSFIYKEGQLECKAFIDSANYQTIGIYIGADSEDYIYYKMLSRKGRILKHVAVTNSSSMYERTDFYPEALICSNDTAEELTVNGKVLFRVRVFAPRLALFVRP